MSVCRDCYAPIRWVRLETGRPIPVDPHPFPDKGNVAAKQDGNTLVGYVVSRSKPLKAEYLTYMPHHASCKPDKPAAPTGRTPSLFDKEPTT